MRVYDLSCCMVRQRKWQKNTVGLHCWITHSRRILNGIHVAVTYNGTNRKFTFNAVCFTWLHPKTNLVICYLIIIRINLFLFRMLIIKLLVKWIFYPFFQMNSWWLAKRFIFSVIKEGNRSKVYFSKRSLKKKEMTSNTARRIFFSSGTVAKARETPSRAILPNCMKLNHKTMAHARQQTASSNSRLLWGGIWLWKETHKCPNRLCDSIHSSERINQARHISGFTIVTVTTWSRHQMLIPSLSRAIILCYTNKKRDWKKCKISCYYNKHTHNSYEVFQSV